MPHYRVTGPWVIEEVGPQPETLDKAIKLAEEYAQSHIHNSAPVFMKVLTEHHPVEYAFGCYIVNGRHSIDPEKVSTSEGESIEWHEICRIIPPF